MLTPAQHPAKKPPPVPCQDMGHRWQPTFMPGERLCLRCGITAYCPACIRHYALTDRLIYCSSHRDTSLALERRPPQ